MMIKGLLWYDDNPGRTLQERVERARARYAEKWGRDPDVCYVHPSMMVKGMTAVGSVRVVALPSVLRQHYWIGRENQLKGESNETERVCDTKS